MMIHKHNNMNRKIWKNENVLHTNVRDVMFYVVWGFIDFVRNNSKELHIKNQDIIDIIFYGDLVNYFYDKLSDVNICVVLDLKHLKQKDAFHMLNAFYDKWIQTHICKIYGHKIKMRFTDKHNPPFMDRYTYGSEYSIIRNEWIFKPLQITNTQLCKIRDDSVKTYKQIMRDFHIVKKNNFVDAIPLYNNIQKSFEMSLVSDYTQPITPMYFAYKKIQQRKILQKLEHQIIKKQSKKFVLK